MDAAIYLAQSGQSFCDNCPRYSAPGCWRRGTLAASARTNRLCRPAGGNKFLAFPQTTRITPTRLGREIYFLPSRIYILLRWSQQPATIQISMTSNRDRITQLDDASL